jgi:hypothetical protein
MITEPVPVLPQNTPKRRRSGQSARPRIRSRLNTETRHGEVADHKSVKYEIIVKSV